MKNKNVPAFPCPTENRLIESNYLSEEIIGYGGMDLRDYFAAKAMQSIIIYEEGDFDLELLARESYRMADAMMKAREK
jgi:hypothetical protein